ncbi:hypothetical protein J4219_00195 [Candidatus Woesearchaeota archaeon]|nr:hypothetical protein [Candidatus Woesearchaeota archaeon]
MIEKIANLVRTEIENAIVPTVRHVQKKIIFFAIKTTLLVLALIASVAGVTLLGAKYIGLDLMLILAGVVLFIGAVLFK